MKIIEVRDGFIKFEADEETCLSAFIQIRGNEKDYVAQVTQLKEGSDCTIGYAKILFLLTEEGLQNYDKTLPTIDSEIVEFTSDILCNSIEVTDPIIVGKTFNNELNITIDSSAFNKKMLVCTDHNNTNNVIVKNLTKQFKNLGKKVVIIDTLGVIDGHKYFAGVDFKLPLNTDSLGFMYKDCLNEATADSKSLIVEIFKDLSEYSKTVPFVPFKTLTSIVNDMFDSSHVLKLFVLKTKLNKLSKFGYFADNYSDVKKINDILQNECVIFDLSKLDSPFQNQYLKYIYESLNDIDVQVILELSNSISKKNIKSVYTNEQISTTFITDSSFKYINDIKNIFDNFIIEPSSANNDIFEIYSTFLSSMTDSSYLIVGEATNYIPLVSVLTDIDDLPLIEKDLSMADIDSETSINTADIIASIDEKSETAIEEVAENLKTPNKFSLFDDETEYTIEDNKSEESVEENVCNETLSQKEEINDGIETNDEEVSESYESYASNEGIKESNVPEEFKNDDEQLDADSVTESEVDRDSSVEYATVVTQNIPEESEDEITGNAIEDAESNDADEEIAVPSSMNLESNEDVEEVSIEADSDMQEELTEADEPIIIDNDIDLDFEDTADGEAQHDYNDITEEIPKTEDVDNNFKETIEKADDVVIPVSENDDSELEEIVELDVNDVQDNDIIVDMGETLNELSDSAEEEIIKDVDKVFTTRKDDDISDNDLDLIDELNNNDDEIILEDSDVGDLLDEESSDKEVLSQETVYDDDEENETINTEILEKRDASTPIVPVYDAEIPEEDMVVSDPIQQGDSVMHAKYGSGVVEKMIKYGNKTLFSINFDNVGRRLLDPTLTEIKKS